MKSSDGTLRGDRAVTAVEAAIERLGRRQERLIWRAAWAAAAIAAVGVGVLTFVALT